MKKLNILAAAAALALATQAACAAPDTYTAVRVDHVYGEHFFKGIAMNAQAAIVGYSGLPDGVYWYTGPQALTVQDPPTVITYWRDMGAINGINDAGQTTGSYDLYDASFQGPHAYVTSPDGKTLTDKNPPGAISSIGTAIDAQGRIVGCATNAQGTHAVRTGADGKLHALPTLGGNKACAAGFNAHGVVVGYSTVASGDTHAFVTGQHGAGVTDLGTLGGDYANAVAVNLKGWIVGSSKDAGGVSTAFIVAPGSLEMSSVTALDGTGRYAGHPSEADGLDADGHVVGSAEDNDKGQRPIAFITGRNGVGIRDLNDFVTGLPKGERVARAAAINASGQILADSSIDGEAMWLLTPTRATWAAEIDAGR